MDKKVEHKGSCLCGAVRYAFDDGSIATAACHCKDCQKSTGSAYALLLVIPSDSIALQGELSTWAVVADSGRTNTRRFCAACGSLITEQSSGLKDYLFLLAGSLDDPSWVRPDFHCWVSSKQDWINLDGELPAFEKGPNLASLVGQ